MLACLEKHFRLQPEQASTLFSLGAIYRDKRRIFADQPLKQGDYIRVHLFPKRFDTEGIDWRKRLVHEGPDFIVVDKPANVPVHATVDNNLDNVLQKMRETLGIPLFVTQRIDVPVRGLVVYGKTPKFQARFNRLLGERKVHKLYTAITEVQVPEGLHVHFMEPSERAPKRVESEERPGWVRCELTVRRSGTIALDGLTAWSNEIELHTGRTHQIRAQVSRLGAPILGDGMYGSKLDFSKGPKGAIALFSTEVRWDNFAFRLPEWQA